MDTSLDNPRQALLGSALVALGAAGFSAKAVLVKLAYAESVRVDAVTLMTLRMLIALPFFLAVALWARDPGSEKRSNRDWTGLAVLGLTGYYLASLLDFKGLEYISAGLERLILFLYPTIVVLLTAILYRRPVTRPQAWALALSYAGIGLVYASQPSAHSPDILAGALLVLGSATVFALFMTGSGHFIPQFGPKRFTAYSMSVACLATIAHFLASKPIGQLAVSPRVLGLAAAMALVSTVAPAFLLSAGIRRIGAANASIIGTLGPVATLGLAYLLLGEHLDLSQALGAILVLCGAVWVSLAKPAS